MVIYDGAFTGVASRSASLNQTMGGFYQASIRLRCAKMTHIVGGGQTSKFSRNAHCQRQHPAGGALESVRRRHRARTGTITHSTIISPSNASSVTDRGAKSQTIVSRGPPSLPAPTFRTRISTVFWTYGRHPDCILIPASGTTASQIDAHRPRRYVWHLYSAERGDACVNLPAMGANPNVPDIFMQIDWMQLQRRR